MIATVKKWLFQLHPELSSRSHLLQWARVTAISDPPEKGEQNAPERPFYAVDIQPLDAQLKPKGFEFKGVPLPLPSAGNSRGLFGFPEIGALVTYGFVDGSPAHPIITNVYGLGFTLPDLAAKELLWQQEEGVNQRCDSEGNWITETPKNLNESVGEVAERIAKLKQCLVVNDGGTVWVGSESVNLVRVLDDLCQVVQQVASTAASHTHEYTDDGAPMSTQPPEQARDFKKQGKSAQKLHTDASPLV